MFLIAQLVMIGLVVMTANSCNKDEIKSDAVINWTNPADIDVGDELSSVQLNATANVAGAFVYTPASGTILNDGDNQTLKVDFTPTDTDKYNSVSKTVTINVISKTDPVITWANAADITAGDELSSLELNATANVAGTFVYTPALGTMLSQGNNQTLKVDFTPTDTDNYNSVSKTVTINVLPVTAAVWTSATTGTLKGISFTITDGGGNSLENYDFSTSDFSAGPLGSNEACISYQGADDWTITFSSPVTNLKLYCKYWRTDTYTFDNSFNILSGSGLSASGSTVTGVSYADGIIKFSGTISSLSVTSTQGCCSSQAMTFGL